MATELHTVEYKDRRVTPGPDWSQRVEWMRTISASSLFTKNEVFKMLGAFIGAEASIAIQSVDTRASRVVVDFARFANEAQPPLSDVEVTDLSSGLSNMVSPLDFDLANSSTTLEGVSRV